MLIILKGFGLGLGLIAAIGAQNAFVLSQGIKKQYYILVPIICMCCDAFLISLGVAGVGSFLMSSPLLTTLALYGGVAFLFWTGLRSFISMFKNSVLKEDDREITSLKSVVVATLAISLLNPHAYLDTMVLLGSISTQFKGIERLYFAIGAISSSVIWFFTLSIGGNFLSPLFKKPIAWKILDGFVGCMMWFVAYGLIKTGL